MRSVHRGLVVWSRRAGRGHEIDIRIFLHRYIHKTVNHFHSVSLALVAARVEVAALPVDGLLEDHRDSRMSGLNLLDEREQPLLDLLRSRVGERVEHECVHVGGAKHVREIWLELAVAAASEAQELESGHSGKLIRVGHPGSGSADSVREAGSEYSDPVTERIIDGLDDSTFVDTDLDGLLLAQDRQVHKALVHRTVQIADKHDVVVRFLVVRHLGGGPEPFPVFLYVKVIASCGESSGVGREPSVKVFGLDRYGLGIRPERHGKTGRHPDLLVLSGREPLELNGVHPVVRVRSVGHKFADHSQVGRLGEIVLHRIFLRGHRHCRERQHQDCDCFSHIVLIFEPT